MRNDTIFALFRTFRQPYVYDRHTNALVVLSEDEFQELVKVKDGSIPADQSAVIKKYQEQGLFIPNVVEEIEHPSTFIIEQFLNSRITQLTLQVCQNCNLRCSYCAYSGSYKGQRTHSNKRMSIATAKKAIDFLLERSSELAEVTVGFYGGEPLLEFDLIKQCVEYAKQQVEGKTVRFTITTNGTLLSGSIVDFLVDNDFSLNISLDGDKMEHDKSRKFVNGDGTFDIIIKNIADIRARYPEFDKKISILTTINPHADLGCVMEYFTTDELFSDRSVIFNNLVERNYIGELDYDDNYYSIRNYEYVKLLFSLAGKLDKKYVSPLVRGARGMIKQRQRGIANPAELAARAHHSGPCLPGVKRPFVRVDGTILPCERVDELSDYFAIGNLEDGFDLEKIKTILNVGKLTECECSTCWGLRQCMFCAAQLEFETTPSEKDKSKYCPKNLSTVIQGLHELCVLNEFGFASDEMEVY